MPITKSALTSFVGFSLGCTYIRDTKSGKVFRNEITKIYHSLVRG